MDGKTESVAGRGSMVRGPGEVRLELFVDAQEAMVMIADSGPGIPKRLQTKIFERFFTTKESGTGIGLHIAKEIVESHRGRIELRSAKGEGTVFEISVPLCQPSQQAGTAREQRSN